MFTVLIGHDFFKLTRGLDARTGTFKGAKLVIFFCITKQTLPFLRFLALFRNANALHDTISHKLKLRTLSSATEAIGAAHITEREHSKDLMQTTEQADPMQTAGLAYEK
ncbi:MAG: hypothetical protein KBT12_04180 [Bacteroidales bacterium]|nr:hypothetical protein [Candidatus Physcousia equi]